MEQYWQTAIEALQQAANMPSNFQSSYQKGDQVWLEATHLKLPY